MFSLAFSVLFLAQSVPSTAATTPSDVVPAVQVVGSTPVATNPSTLPAAGNGNSSNSNISASTVPAAALVLPGTIPTTVEPVKTTTVKGQLTKVDTTASTISVTPNGTSTATTFQVSSLTAITLDDAPSKLEALAPIGSAAVTVTTDSSGTNATAIAAISPPWWARILGQTNPIFLMIIPLGLFMLMSIRNKKKQERAQQEKLGSIKRGDRIQTIGGIMGNVVQTEDTRILVKVDESNNTKIWFTRAAVARVVSEEKSDVKAK